MKSLLSEERAKRYSKLFWLNDNILAKWICEILSVYGESICDIGVGNGYMLPVYNEYFNSVSAIEPSPSMYNRFTKKEIDLFKIKQKYDENISFRYNSVDIAFSKSSFHHFYNKQKTLNEMNRISKKAIAILEVVIPTDECRDFLTQILLMKENTRDTKSILSEDDLKRLLHKFNDNILVLYFDQYIDV